MRITFEEITKAQKVLADNKIVVCGKYNKEFNGYISSFGASLVHAGLLPTVIFFENKDSSAEKDRHFVISALKQMLGIDSSVAMSKYIIEKKKVNDQVLVDKVTRAMTAMKLALRMYEKK